MGRLQSSVGLVSGLDIQGTVEQLLKIEARPRDLTASRNEDLTNQQVAVTDLTAAVVAVQLAARNLGKADTFSKKTVASSDPAALSAMITGTPSVGTYEFTSVRKAQAHHLLSSGFAARDEPLGAGSFSFGFGGFIDAGVSLDELNDGQGVQRGEIRIIDRSGASSVVDLRYAQTIDDVLEAINTTDGIDVEAVAEGDAIRLIDHTGGAGNLKVEEISGGSTAADLGLDGVNVAADEALGEDLLRLYDGLSLSKLNDGNGVDLNEAVPDLDITFRDGSSLLVDFLAGTTETTLGDLVDTLNAADPARLQAAISASGDSIEITDLTSGGGTFEVSGFVNDDLVHQLGLDGAAVGGVITSRDLRGGLKTSLLSSLQGGRGFEGGLGQLDLTDRSGASATVDLSSAQTLDDVVDAANAAAVGITARVNDSRNGILLEDTTGLQTNNLIVADGVDGLETATKLGIAVDDAVDSIDSGSLDLKRVNRGTQLDDYKEGVANGTILITDANGTVGVLKIDDTVETLGDVIDAINNLSFDVTARINDRGDGIAIIDSSAGGTGTLEVRDVTGGTAAQDLGISGDGVEQEIDGELKQVVEGSLDYNVEIDANDTLEDLVGKINDLGAPVSASLLSDGSGSTPYHLSIVSGKSGKSGELLIDTSQVDFTFHEISKARDALLLVGGDGGAAGVLVSSADNHFDDLLDGVGLELKEATNSPVSVSVATTNSSVISTVQLFVDTYNKLAKKLDDLTFFNEQENKTGVLFGSVETLRVESEVSNLLSGEIAQCAAAAGQATGDCLSSSHGEARQCREK